MILEFGDSEANTVSRRCSCKDEQGHCHQLGFTAYAELSSMKGSDGVSVCTSKPQQIQWHVRRGPKIDPQHWMQLNFSKPSVGKESTRGVSLCFSQ